MLRCFSSVLVLRFTLLLLVSLSMGAPAFASRDSVPDWVRAAIAQPQGKFPAETSAVVLLDNTTLSVGSDGKSIEKHRRVVKILRPNGREQGLVGVPFDKDTKILSFHVWSVGPDGHEYQMKDDEMMEIGYPGQGNFYEDMRMKLAKPAGLDPGGVVAYEYEQRNAPYEHESTWFFQDDIPHMQQSYTLELPTGYAYQTVWAHHELVKPADLEGGRYRWDLSTTPAIDLDRVPMAPSMKSLMGRMTIHYAPKGQTSSPIGTWQEVGDFYDQLARDRMVSNPEIAAKTAELVAGSPTFTTRLNP